MKKLSPEQQARADALRAFLDAAFDLLISGPENDKDPLAEARNAPLGRVIETLKGVGEDSLGVSMLGLMLLAKAKSAAIELHDLTRENCADVTNKVARSQHAASKIEGDWLSLN